MKGFNVILGRRLLCGSELSGVITGNKASMKKKHEEMVHGSVSFRNYSFDQLSRYLSFRSLVDMQSFLPPLSA